MIKNIRIFINNHRHHQHNHHKKKEQQSICFKKITSNKEISNTIDELTNNINEWYSGDQPEDTCKETAIWYEREEDTNSILELFKENNIQQTEEDILASYYNGKNIGLMSFYDNKNKKCLSVSLLITHPATSGLGGLFLEKIANLSQEKGYSGKIQLETWESGSTYKKYEKLGMEKTKIIDQRGGIEMILDPYKSTRWSQDKDKKWHLLCC